MSTGVKTQQEHDSIKHYDETKTIVFKINRKMIQSHVFLSVPIHYSAIESNVYCERLGMHQYTQIPSHCIQG